MKVIKRDGRAVEFNNEKIVIAIEKANMEVTEEKKASKKEINKIVNYIESLDKKRILVEDIQDIIEEKLMELKKYDLAKKYIVYRYTRALVRRQNTTDESILGLIKNINSNSSIDKSIPSSVETQRELIAGEVSKDLTKRILLPEKIAKAHEDGVLYFHATEYFLQPIIDSCYVNIGDMLNNGTRINGINVSTPNNFQEACIVISNIIEAISKSQYGMQYINLKHLGKYLRKSHEALVNNFKPLENFIDKRMLQTYISKIVDEQLLLGIETIQCQINGIAPKYGKANLVTLILTVDDEDEYYKENLMICTAVLKNKEKCTNTLKNTIVVCDFKIKDKSILNELLELTSNLDTVTSLESASSCKYEGFFNQGMVSINLPQIALNISKNAYSINSTKETYNVDDINEGIDEFFRLLNQRLEICYDALMCKHYALLGTLSNVSPIHWQDGAIARLQPQENIDRLLKSEYSDISLGYIGFDIAINILEKTFGFDDVYRARLQTRLKKVMEDKTQAWGKMTGICYSLKQVTNERANMILYEIDKNNYGDMLENVGIYNKY